MNELKKWTTLRITDFSSVVEQWTVVSLRLLYSIGHEFKSHKSDYTHTFVCISPPRMTDMTSVFIGHLAVHTPSSVPLSIQNIVFFEQLHFVPSGLLFIPCGHDLHAVLVEFTTCPMCPHDTHCPLTMAWFGAHDIS